MANAKITELEETTSLDGTEYFAVVEDPSGTPVTKKSLISRLITYLSGTYAGVDHNATHEVGGSDPFTGLVPASAFVPGGLTGATAASRYVGGTTGGPPTSGTFAVGDFVVTQAGRIWVCKTAGTPGTWEPLISADEKDYSLPSGAKAQTVPRDTSMNGDATALLTSGRLTFCAIYLRTGTVISSISFVSGATPLASGSNQWFCLYDSALNKLKVTADDTSTAWGANTVKTLSLSGGSYTVPTSGMYYVGICVVASTTPSLRCGQLSAAVLPNIAPVQHGQSTTGLTDPASAPNPAAAITAASNRAYAYVS